MNALLLAPHNDDETLFAAFTCHALKPELVTVLRSVVQEKRGTGITAEQRELETKNAASLLGCRSPFQMPHSDAEPDWKAIREDFACLERQSFSWEKSKRYERVYAPFPEAGGHEHHNTVGEIAVEVFGQERVWFYVTYVNGRQRNEIGELVQPTSEAIAAKLRALACYTSQIAEPSTSHHFMHSLHERVVAPR